MNGFKYNTYSGKELKFLCSSCTVHFGSTKQKTCIATTSAGVPLMGTVRRIVNCTGKRSFPFGSLGTFVRTSLSKVCTPVIKVTFLNSKGLANSAISRNCSDVDLTSLKISPIHLDWNTFGSISFLSSPLAILNVKDLLGDFVTWRVTPPLSPDTRKSPPLLNAA